jgi:hypothetical protein
MRVAPRHIFYSLTGIPDAVLVKVCEVPEPTVGSLLYLADEPASVTVDFHYESTEDVAVLRLESGALLDVIQFGTGSR